MFESGTWYTQSSSRDTPRSTSESVFGGGTVGRWGGGAEGGGWGGGGFGALQGLVGAAQRCRCSRGREHVPCRRRPAPFPPTLMRLRGAIISSVSISRLERFSRASAASSLEPEGG
jgi:hypothetical protein